MPRDCLFFVIVVFPDHTHLLFLPNLVTHLCIVEELGCHKWPLFRPFLAVVVLSGSQSHNETDSEINKEPIKHNARRSRSFFMLNSIEHEISTAHKN